MLIVYNVPNPPKDIDFLLFKRCLYTEAADRAREPVINLLASNSEQIIMNQDTT